MNNLYVYILGGIVCVGCGLYLTIHQSQKIAAGEDDELGFDYKGLGCGIMLIMLGITIF
jgi:hypothetical protein